MWSKRMLRDGAYADLGDRGHRPAQHGGGEIDEYLVGQTRGEKGARHGRSSLDEHVAHVALGEHRQEAR